MKKINEEEYRRILAYLGNEMSEQEADEYRKLIKQDIDLFDEVEEVKATIKAAQKLHYLKELDELEHFEMPEPEKKEEDVKERPLWTERQWLLAAAVVAVAVGVGILFWLNNGEKPGIDNAISNAGDTLQTPTKDKATLVVPEARDAAEYYISQGLDLKNVPSRFAGDVTGINTADGLRASIEKLKSLGLGKKTDTGKAENPDEIKYGSGGTAVDEKQKTALSASEENYRKLLLGISYVKAGRYNEAVVVLDQVKEKSLAQDVLWYKGLSYIQSGELEKGRKSLAQVSDPRYEEGRKEILEKLK
ncbi:hypothetical protein LZD49_09990 [Dyadobacter sp. CY261]|uniref:tetratricopeptide repeat protein n=1 Tax=Dyadobacter sp. CY261 TaxID=2907203 RepID=UPI001F424EED|nr:tetratricopeptide repeat protein [Dyadobacter sp. CY261]MCF0070802.1 hypothetical protein [Dyadobacter sp. CY261]